jgi:rhomboid family GlyGly-CTERM serine protease
MNPPALQIGKLVRAPLLLFVLPAVMVAFATARHGQLVLARNAVAEGEIWRLWSGHWVHFSASHLLWNLAVLLPVGMWLERLRPGLLWRHVLVATPLVSCAILTLEPDLQTYGGLSALATSVVVLLALRQCRAARAGRWLWISVLALVAAKILAEARFGGAGFARYESASVRTAWSAHAAGALAAVFHQGWMQWKEGGASGKVTSASPGWPSRARPAARSAASPPRRRGPSGTARRSTPPRAPSA